MIYTVQPDGTLPAGSAFPVARQLATGSGPVDCGVTPCGLVGVVRPGEPMVGYPIALDDPSNNPIQFASEFDFAGFFSPVDNPPVLRPRPGPRAADPEPDAGGVRPPRDGPRLRDGLPHPPVPGPAARPRPDPGLPRPDRRVRQRRRRPEGGQDPRPQRAARPRPPPGAAARADRERDDHGPRPPDGRGPRGAGGRRRGASGDPGVGRRRSRTAAGRPGRPRVPLGIVAVAAGDGLAEALAAFGIADERLHVSIVRGRPGREPERRARSSPRSPPRRARRSWSCRTTRT